MNIKSIVNKRLKKHRYNAVKQSYLSLYQKMMRYGDSHFNQTTSLSKENEKEWLKKWQKYDSKISPLSYRVFSRYIGHNLNIFPMELLIGIVEPVLNPEFYRNYYNDKNSLDQIFCGLSLPKIYMRNINGVDYDGEYKRIDSPLSFAEKENRPQKIILKPARDCSGHGVRLLVWTNDCYCDNENNQLSIDYLKSTYKSDFLIQEAITQSSFLAQFNPTSVNTIRIATYRGVYSGEVHVINSVLRIGASGKNVDNAHAGGMFTGINKENGKLGTYVCNYLGHTQNEFNNIDFAHNDFTIPGWEKVYAFAIEVSERLIHHNLVAMDIALDESNNPKLIEINVGGFGGWVFQFTTGSVFGEFTDEVMEYCWRKYKNLAFEITYK